MAGWENNRSTRSDSKFNSGSSTRDRFQQTSFSNGGDEEEGKQEQKFFEVSALWPTQGGHLQGPGFSKAVTPDCHPAERVRMEKGLRQVAMGGKFMIMEVKEPVPKGPTHKLYCIAPQSDDEGYSQ